MEVDEEEVMPVLRWPPAVLTAPPRPSAQGACGSMLCGQSRQGGHARRTEEERTPARARNDTEG
eukprot:1220588-Rhodomonas_salina.2